MKNTILLILLFSIISCSTTEDVKLVENADLVSVYNKNEISSLELVLNFFDTFILEQVDSKSIDDAYHEYFESMRNVESLEELIGNFKLTSNDFNDLLKSAKDGGVFNEIWQYEYGIDYKTKDTLTVCLIPNVQGKYMELLELVGQRDDYLKEYVNSINECSCIPLNVVSGFQHLHDEPDFKKEINRLIWAIHYITIISEEKLSKQSK